MSEHIERNIKGTTSNSAWMYVIIGGLLEIFWVIGMKYSDGFTDPIPSVATAVLLMISFYFFSKSMKLLPVGTAYAVFTGIGSAGAASAGMLVLGEPAGLLKVFFILLLIGCVIGLKFSSPDEETEAETN